MRQNMLASGGVIYSSQVLTELVASGLDRDKAYELIQKSSHNLNGSDFYSALKAQKELKKYLPVLEKIFSSAQGFKHLDGKLKKILNNRG